MFRGLLALICCVALVQLVAGARVHQNKKQLDSQLLQDVHQYDVIHLHNYHFDTLESSIPVVDPETIFGTARELPLLHPELTSFRLQLAGDDVTVNLEKNTKLFADRYTEQHQVYVNGVRHEELTQAIPVKTVDHIEHCYYQGSTSHSDKRLAMNTCEQGFNGFVYHEDEMYVVKPALQHLPEEEVTSHMHRLQAEHAEACTGSAQLLCTPVSQESLHVVYKSSHYLMGEENEAHCGVQEEHTHGLQAMVDSIGHPTKAHAHDHSHQHAQTGDATVAAETQTISIPLGNGQSAHMNLQAASTCDSVNDDSSCTQYVELLIVNDVARYVYHNEAPEASSADIVNSASTYYQNTFGSIIDVILVGQVTFPTEDPWNNTLVTDGTEVDHAQLLSDFHSWRYVPGQTVAHDNGHLLTALDFEGGTVGYAGVQSMCFASSSGGINQCTRTDSFNAAIFAHELGHNFGFLHDSTSGNTCPSSGFIMNAIIGSTHPTEFSTCSMDYYDAWNPLGRNCLDNYPEQVYTEGTPVCGNGVWESGEGCDCGNAVSCAGLDECCDATTCELASTATCSSFQACCDSTCNLKPAGEVCRSAVSDCDLEEYCDGEASSCTANQVKGVGSSCSSEEDGDGTCFNGYCMSVNYDCRVKGSLYQYSPYSECDSPPTAFFDNPCGTIYCQDSLYGVCVTFSTTDLNGNPADDVISDGVGCGSGQQCLEGECVSSSYLNPYFQWKVADWSDCFDCSETQTRAVTCRELQASGLFVNVDELFCSPADRPPSTQSCLVRADTGEVCVHASTDNIADAIAREIEEKYGAADKAAALRSIVPRTCDENDFDVSDPAYQTCMAYLSIPGLIGVVASTIFIGMYLCCPTKCECFYGCDHEETKKEHNKRVKANNALHEHHQDEKMKQEPGFHEGRMGPVAVVLFTFLIMMVFGAVGYFYNGEVRRGFGDEIVGIVAVTSEMLKEAELLTFTLLTQLTGLLDTAPVLDTVVPELTGMISPLNEGADGFANLTVQTGFYMNATDLVVEGQGEALYTSPDVNILCAMCRSAEDDLAQIAEDVRVSSADSFAELQDSVNNADIWLSEFRFLLEEGGDIEWAQTQANDMDVYLSESRETLSDYIAWMNDMDEVRWTFTILFFGLPFICFALVLAGFCLKNSACLRCNIVVSFFQLFICWLMFTFHLPIAMVLSDTCSYMAQVESNPLEALNLTETSSSVFLACLANTSLVDAMNITDDLQFADLVWFPDPMPDADTMFDLQTLYDYEEDALNQTVADFYDADVVDTAFSALNVYTDPDVFDETNIESCDPTVYTDTTEVRTLKWDIITGLDAADSANNTATEINQNVTGLVSAADSLKTDTNVIISDLDGVVAQMDPIIDNTEGFVTSAYCGSIGDQYFLFKVALCDVETTAFSYLALSFFMIGVFQFFNLWVNIVMIKRIHHEEHESKRTKGGHRRRNPDGSHHDPDHQGEEFTDIATAQDDSNANLRIHLRESVSRQGSRHGQTPPVHSRSLRRQQPKRTAQTPRGTRRQARPSVAPRFDAHAQPAHASSGPARPVQQGSQSARVTGRRLRRKKSSKADNTNVIEMGNLKITYD